MKAGLSLGAAFIIIGNGTYAAAQWLLTIAVARKFGAEALGVLALCMAISGPLQAFTNSALKNVYLVEKKAAFHEQDYIVVRILSSFLFLALLSIVGVFLSYFVIAGGFFMLLAVGVLRISESIADILQGFMNKAGDLPGVGLSAFFRAISFSLAVLGLLYLGRPLWVCILAGAIFANIATFTHDVFRALRATGMTVQDWFALDRKELRPLQLLKRSLPIGLAHCFVLFQPAAPRYGLQVFSGSATLGVFSAMSVFIAIGNLVIGAISQATLPLLAAALRDRDTNRFKLIFSRVLATSVAVGLAGIAVSWAYGKNILTFIYGEEFAVYSKWFPLVMTLGMVNYISTCLGNLATATGKFNNFISSYGFVTLLSFALSFFLVKPLGLLGALICLITISMLNGFVAFRLFQSGIQASVNLPKTTD